MTMVTILSVALMIVSVVIAAVVATERALRFFFKKWDVKRTQYYDDVALHLWDRNDRPAYRDYKHHAVLRRKA
jgi:hypothetical protein